MYLFILILVKNLRSSFCLCESVLNYFFLIFIFIVYQKCTENAFGLPVCGPGLWYLNNSFCKNAQNCERDNLLKFLNYFGEYLNCSMFWIEQFSRFCTTISVHFRSIKMMTLNYYLTFWAFDLLYVQCPFCIFKRVLMKSRSLSIV